MTPKITVVGGGLAGCEAALQLARLGLAVELVEMRPVVKTPAHDGDSLAQIVCSNSLKSTAPATASGLLKDELDQLGCRLLALARRCRTLSSFLTPQAKYSSVRRWYTGSTPLD